MWEIDVLINLTVDTVWSLISSWLTVPCVILEGSSEEDQEGSGGETELDAHGVDQELKHHLLKKYSGYLSSLKQELSKKKKKGKLPKEARQQLLSWWDLHYKWPYPSVRLLSMLPFLFSILCFHFYSLRAIHDTEAIVYLQFLGPIKFNVITSLIAMSQDNSKGSIHKTHLAILNIP